MDGIESYEVKPHDQLYAIYEIVSELYTTNDEITRQQQGQLVRVLKLSEGLLNIE